MIRILIITFLSLSILLSSNINSDNFRGMSNKNQGNTTLNKLGNLKKNTDQIKADSQEKAVAAKKTENKFKNDLDNKLNIAKKIYSAKTNKKSYKNTSQLNKLVADPNSFELKMKRPASANAFPKSNRNIVNIAQDRDGHIDGIEIPWTGTPGELEAAIDANGGSGVFILEADKTYLMENQVILENGNQITIIGAPPVPGEHPATIQPFVNEGFNTWGMMFILNSDYSELTLHHLILNGMKIDGTNPLGGIAISQANENKIVVDHCVVSSFASPTLITTGIGTDFHITNSIFTDFTSYPGGAFWGGVLWGGGSWMGTMDMLVVENNTFQGIVGEGIVAYEYVDEGSRINHNTFANISMRAIYYLNANNLQITNNVFYNTGSWGQTRYDAALNPVVDANGDPVMNDDGTQQTNGWGVVWPGGVGQLETRKSPWWNEDGFYTMSDGQFVDLNDRNIHWGNNAVVWSQGLIDWVNNHAGEDADGDGYGDIPCYTWTYIQTDENGNEYEATIEDHQLVLEKQAVVHSDTTLDNIARMVGITSSDNILINYFDFNMSLDPNYLDYQLARTDDFKDNQSTDGVGQNYEWVYQHDENHMIVEWPLHLDISYNETSGAYTHSDLGLPVGNLHAFPDKHAEWVELTTPITGVEFGYENVADLFEDFENVLHYGDQPFIDNDNYDQLLGNLEEMWDYVVGSVADDYDANFIRYDLFENLTSEYGFQNFYFQFKDDNGNMEYDDGEIYAVSCEDGENGENFTVSFRGDVYDLDFVEFWMMAYDFEFYPEDGDDDGADPIWFDFVGDMDGHWYFVSQEPMSWHDGLNFTDTVYVGSDMIHLATITSQEENDFVKDVLYQADVSSVWIGLTDEYEEGVWQWVSGEPVDYTNWIDGEPNNSGELEHYAEMYPFSGEWNDAPHDFANRVLIEYIPNQAMNIAGEWQIAPMPGALRVGPEPFNGDWWSNSAEDVQVRACYFDDRYVFDQDGFHNDQGDETWIEFWQGGDYNGDGNLDLQDDHCGAPMYPHDGSSNPAGVVVDEALGTLALNGVGAYIGLPKAANGFELASPDQAPESVTYQMYVQDSPRMMTLVINVSSDENNPIFWTFDLVPAVDGESIYFAKEDYADVMNSDNWDHVTPSVAIMRGDNQGLYNPYVEDSYNGYGPSGTLWSVGSTSEADPMGYMEWVDAISGQAANLPGQTLSMWCLAENLYFDIEFESWTNGNNGGGFSYWRTLVAPPAGPTMHLVSGMMGSDETGDGSFENPFATIGHAMANMNNNDWIVVGPGVYEESLSSYEMSGLLLSISGSDSTFISGSGQNRIMEIDYGNWLISGFTFLDGNTDGDGAAIKIHDGSLMVGGSRFVNNTAINLGGAIAAVNVDIMMDSVSFVMNHSVQADGGGLFVENNQMDQYRNVSITNSVFVENTANDLGGGVRIGSYNNTNTNVYLDQVEFLQNSAFGYSGFNLDGNVWGGVYNSSVAGNQAQGYAAGGGATSGANLYMDFCLIAGNQANLNGGTNNAGGIALWGSSFGGFYQCTFVGNSAEYGSALTVGRGSGATVDASIVWNNPGDNALAAVQWDDNGSNLDVYNSVVQGGESGMYADELSYLNHDGVLDIDPFFCDPANGNFSIDVLSGAITPWGEPMGALGYGCEGTVMVSANILSVEDVPNDQGGRVYVTFSKSLFDTDGLGRTEMYTVERMDGDQWVGLTSVGAYASEVYVVEATTLEDSTSESDGMETYRVVANMDEGNFESEHESGYSVDNIAPMIVTGLNAEVADGMVMLSWSHSEANDFSHYMVYYSTIADFIPSEETMIGTHSDPSFEHDIEEIGDHYYVVSAMDIHENESEHSEEVNVTLLSLVDVHGLPEIFALHQNYPNPFNPSTTIRYDLPEASSVSLIIYDMMGREVATLLNGQVDAGYHFLQWDGTNSIGSSVAAGVYIYTIQAGKHRDVSKMIYLK